MIGKRNVLKSRTAAQRKAARNPENVQEIAKSSDLCSSHQVVSYPCPTSID